MILKAMKYVSQSSLYFVHKQLKWRTGAEFQFVSFNGLEIQRNLISWLFSLNSISKYTQTIRAYV